MVKIDAAALPIMPTITKNKNNCKKVKGDKINSSTIYLFKIKAQTPTKNVTLFENLKLV